MDGWLVMKLMFIRDCSIRISNHVGTFLHVMQTRDVHHPGDGQRVESYSFQTIPFEFAEKRSGLK